MSWLVAVSLPAVLMLFTVGLQRLESLVHGDRPPTGELVTRPESAARVERQKAPHRTLNESGPAQQASSPSHRFDPMFFIDEPGLPTRPNPLFQPTGFANPV